MRQTRFSRGWLVALSMAFVLGGLLALPQGAKASLLGDEFLLTTAGALICDPTVCMDTATVGAGAEFTTGDGSGVGTFFSTFGTASFIDVGDSSITFFFDFGFNGNFSFTDPSRRPRPDGG